MIKLVFILGIFFIISVDVCARLCRVDGKKSGNYKLTKNTIIFLDRSDSPAGETLQGPTNIQVESVDMYNDGKLDSKWYLKLQVIGNDGQPIQFSKGFYKTSCGQFNKLIRDKKIILDTEVPILKDTSKIRVEDILQLVRPKIAVEAAITSPQCVLPPVHIVPINRKVYFRIAEEFKSSEELDDYFRCYKYFKKGDKILKYHNRYLDKYKESITKASEIFSKALINANQSSSAIKANEVNAGLACMLFRESFGWQGVRSKTGAVGIGQFTADGIRFLKNEMLPRIKKIEINAIDVLLQRRQDYNETYDNLRKRYQKKKQKSKVRKLDRKRKKDLAILEQEIKLYYITKMQKDMLENCQCKALIPKRSQINKKYLSNPDNYEVAILFSAMKMMHHYYNISINTKNTDVMERIIGASGMYNMGAGGFTRNAMGRGEDNLRNWIRNIKHSRDKQGKETINHMISIKRCMEKEKNQPSCGADGEAHPKCIGKDIDLVFKKTCNNRVHLMCVEDRVSSKTKKVLEIRGTKCK